ncbi:MAG: MFS transporter, partial [Gammaproteobacteria bacterium]|nr:MFS transporter [Gammaproteobacteria bacterium]
MSALFRIAGFIPFLVMIFLNAFVDLGHKIIIQNTIFKIYDEQTQVILTAIVNGLILLPFVLLFTPAGFLADRFRKPRVMQISAMVAVALTLMITAAYYAGWFDVAFGMTFLLAVQSAFYSPAKYGYIRELTGKSRLAAANAAVQACTIVAILSGIFFFSILFEWALASTVYSTKAEIMQIIAPLGWVLVVCSLFELVAAFRLPMLVGADSGFSSSSSANSKLGTPFNWQRYVSGQSLRSNLSMLRSTRGIWLSIIGLSVFWAISQVVLATYPAFAKETLAITNTVVIQGLLACAGIGIVIGSLLASRVSARHIETGLIPVGALGVVITLALLPQLESLPLLALDILFFGLCGGLFIIPLNALIQF